MTASARTRVIHLIDSGGVYGAEKVILNLSREMRESDDFQPVVGCLVRHGKQDVALLEAAAELGIEACRIRLRNALWFVDIFSIARQLRSMDIGVIHSHGYKPAVFGVLANLFAGLPMTSTCHLWYLDKMTRLPMRFLVRTELFFYRFFRQVVAVSNDIRRVLMQSGVPGDRIRVVPNGIVMSDFGASAKNEGRDVASSEESFCVVNVGRLTAQKAQQVVIEAAARLRDEGYPAEYLIVGEGELRGELETLIRDNDIGDTVTLTGFQPDIGRILGRADVLVLPSLDEGMPIALLEAAASRVPVIVTAVGDIPNLIENEVSGLIIDAGDPEALARAVAHVFDDREHAARMADTAYDRMLDTYSSTAMWSAYREIYRTLTNGTAPRR